MTDIKAKISELKIQERNLKAQLKAQQKADLKEIKDFKKYVEEYNKNEFFKKILKYVEDLDFGVGTDYDSFASYFLDTTIEDLDYHLRTINQVFNLITEAFGNKYSITRKMLIANITETFEENKKIK